MFDLEAWSTGGAAPAAAPARAPGRRTLTAAMPGRGGAASADAPSAIATRATTVLADADADADADARPGFDVDRLLGGEFAREVDGRGGYRYRQRARGAITIVAGPRNVGRTYPVGDRVNAAITAELTEMHGRFPPTGAPTRNGAAAPAPAGAAIATAAAGWLDAARAGLAWAEDHLLGAVEVADGGAALVASMSALVRQSLGLDGGPAGPAPAPGGAATAGAGGRDAGPSSAGGVALDRNLAEAKRLADQLSIPHAYDHDGQGKHGASESIIVDPLTTGARAKAIQTGDASQLQTIVCSEFTNLTLARSGVKLTDRFLVPGERVPLAWTKDGRGASFITLYGVSNFQPEANGALIAYQRGQTERVVAGSARAQALGHPDTTFHLFHGTTFVGGGLQAGDQFGAGAVAVAQGGRAIAPADRRPGDLQQAAETTVGAATGVGHSSQVWTVRGPGVVRLGEPGSPTVNGHPAAPVATLRGWYRIAPGGALAFEVGPATDPALVASLTCVAFTLIEANVGKAGDDATAVSGVRHDGASQVVSAGRLPTSKWIADLPRDVVGVEELR